MCRILHAKSKMEGGARWLNSYADLNEIVRVDLESLPFMDFEVAQFALSIDETVPEKARRCRTIRELIQSEQKLVYSKRALFEMFDILDVMNDSLRIHKNQENEHFKFHVHRMNEIATRLLNEYGIVEIDVLNQTFDPNTSEVLATVKAQEYDSDQPHLYHSEQVIAVHQRAFREVDSGELLRKAKVTVIE
jgi:molecular chaperone GrpE (heat shock protein)